MSRYIGLLPPTMATCGQLMHSETLAGIELPIRIR
jgi:hypothetical protein